MSDTGQISQTEILWDIFGSSTPLMENIARCESVQKQFDENGFLLRGKVDPDDVGYFQINMKYHNENALKMGYNITTFLGNAEEAKLLYDRFGTQPWDASKDCWNKLSP